MFDLLTQLVATGTTVVFITHDLALADTAHRVVAMLDGAIESVTDQRSGGR